MRHHRNITSVCMNEYKGWHIDSTLGFLADHLDYKIKKNLNRLLFSHYRRETHKNNPSAKCVGYLKFGVGVARLVVCPVQAAALYKLLVGEMFVSR